MTKTKVGAEYKDTTLIVDKLYKALHTLNEWAIGDPEAPEFFEASKEADKVLEEYREKYEKNGG